jgi:competence protein ComEC
VRDYFQRGLPEVKKDRTRLVVKTTKVVTQGKEFPIKSRIQITIPQGKETFHYGERVRIKGELTLPPGPRNPGGFNYRDYLTTQKISALVRLDSEKRIEKIGRLRVNPFLSLALHLRKRLIKTIEQTLPSLQGSVLKGILLGRREELPPSLRQAFINTGVTHVLAVSGLHVGLITAIFYLFFSALRFPNRARYLLTFLIVILYCLMTGCRPSVLRATIMFGTGLLALFIGRKQDLYTTLAFAALIILLINPLSLFNVGFQLSFIAVLSILYLYPRIWPRVKFLSRYPAGLIAVSLAAWIGVVPLIAYHFNYFTPVAILANLVVIPLVTVIVALGFTSTIFSFFSGLLAQLASHANWLFLTLLIKAVNFFNYFPGAGIRIITPPISFIAIYYLGIVGLLNFKHSPLVRKVVPIGALCLIALFVWGNIFTLQNNLLKVTILDVGQGDSIFIQFPDRKNMLIDGGSGRYDTLPSYLWDKRIRKIDYLISTHPHTDHLGGLIGVLSNFKVGEVMESGQEHTSATYKEFLEIMEEKKIPYRIARASQSLEGGRDIRIDILHPREELIRYGGSQLNNNSIVIKLTYGKTSFLFTADIEKEAEDLLIRKYGTRLHSTILKVPHQGSKTSSTLKFLKKVSPECAVISVGAHNPFGHPHSEVLKRYRNLRIKVYRTDKNGAVTITTDGKNYWVVSNHLSR